MFKTQWNAIQLIFISIGYWVGWLLGGIDGFLYALIIFTIVDFITGVMCAVVEKRLSSKVGAKGIFKKILIFLLVGLANIIDTQLIGSHSVLRMSVIFFYIANEGISILENAAAIGLPIPKKLTEVLEQLKKEEEDK